MSWKHWSAVIVVIGVGIVLQIRGHREEIASDHGHGLITEGSPVDSVESDAIGPYRTVALEVTGMT